MGWAKAGMGLAGGGGKLEKIRDTRGTFHAKMGTIKDRNGNIMYIKYKTHSHVIL